MSLRPSLVLALLLVLVPASGAWAGQCAGFINPVTDVAWPCIFPIRIGGLVQLAPGSNEDPDRIDNPVCVCNEGALPRVGLTVSFWEPARMIDTVSDPYCFMAIGQQLPNPTPGRLSGSLRRDADGSSKAFQQLHYYIFPVWAALDLFTDLPCMDRNGFDLALITEILPSWNHEFVAMLLHPEVLLFANPVAQQSCAADSLSVLSGLPRDELFWCMGSWSSAYPLAGSITSTDYVAANAGIAARGIYLMGRTGLLMDPAVDACTVRHTPIWRKSHYRLQLMKPVRDHHCLPIGRTGLTWSHGKNPGFQGDNFAWMMFRKVECCVSY